MSLRWIGFESFWPASVEMAHMGCFEPMLTHETPFGSKKDEYWTLKWSFQSLERFVLKIHQNACLIILKSVLIYISDNISLIL